MIGSCVISLGVWLFELLLIMIIGVLSVSIVFIMVLIVVFLLR